MLASPLMRRALDRCGGAVLLGAAEPSWCVSALFSGGSSNGRLSWIGLAALAVAAGVVPVALVGAPRPVLAGGGGRARSWSPSSLERDLGALVDQSLTARGTTSTAGSSTSRSLWSGWLRWVRSAGGAAGLTPWPAALALPLGWALLGKAFRHSGRRDGSRGSARPIGYWNALALLFAMALPLALWLSARREHALAAGTRSRLRLRAGRRADADLLARRCLAAGSPPSSGSRSARRASRARRRCCSAAGPGSASRSGRSPGPALRMTGSATRFACTTAPGSRSCSCSPHSWPARSRTSARSWRSGGR